MRHFADPSFWDCYRRLPPHIQQLAGKNFKILKENPRHVSLHLKKVNEYWSVRIGTKYRVLGIKVEAGVVWVWIGTHAEYDKLVE